MKKAQLQALFEKRLELIVFGCEWEYSFEQRSGAMDVMKIDWNRAILERLKKRWASKSGGAGCERTLLSTK